MEKKDFFDRFNKLLKNIKDKYELPNLHDALIMWFGENYLSLDPDEIKGRIVSDKHAEGIDAFLIDQINYELLFIQAKSVKNFENTMKNFPENDIKTTLEGIRFLLQGEYKGKITPELENLIDEYHDLDKTFDYKTKIIFLTLKEKPLDNKFIESFKQNFPNIDVNFYDFDELYNFYVYKYLTMKAAPPEKISFEVLSNLLIKNSPYKSRVFTCKGKELAKIYNDYKERIFQQNVRYYLGLRSKSINKQILETAVNNIRSKDFWYFNNGITIICEKIDECASRKVLNLEKPQIINGAQTTYALYEAYVNGNLKDEVEVLIKAIETKEKEFIENVTLYTNSQNAIRFRDLCSNDEIQIKIQKILKDSYKYFYERKRGELESSYPTIKEKIKELGKNYKAKIIDNEKAAQSFLAMYLNKPAQAKNEKGRIFLKDNTGFYNDIFNRNDDLLSEKILLSWKLVEYIEKYKKEYKKKYEKAENLQEKEKNKIYKYDFLLHSEYFILNIFKDFLMNIGFNIISNKDNLLKIIDMIEKNDKQIQDCYNTIINVLAEYIDNLKKQQGYYHNKFFKNEKSIGLIRNFFRQKYNFIEII